MKWKTGDEPTARPSGPTWRPCETTTTETFDGTLRKAEASKMIDGLRERLPRLAGE
jgi:hypothetical protein